MTRMLKRDMARLLADVPEQYVFRCIDGTILRNTRDLRDALLSMTNESFAYHANNVKHDFSDWVRDVIGDRKLARHLARSTNRLHSAKIAVDRVALLSNNSVG
jgi:hypothetical protein